MPGSPFDPFYTRQDARERLRLELLDRCSGWDQIDNGIVADNNILRNIPEVLVENITDIFNTTELIFSNEISSNGSIMSTSAVNLVVSTENPNMLSDSIEENVKNFTGCEQLEEAGGFVPDSYISVGFLMAGIFLARFGKYTLLGSARASLSSIQWRSKATDVEVSAFSECFLNLQWICY